MKPTVYTTRRERMTYQIMGFFAFPLVNIPLGIISQQRIDSQLLTLVSVLPWLVNGIVLVLAVLLRPEFASGRLADHVAQTCDVASARTRQSGARREACC